MEKLKVERFKACTGTISAFVGMFILGMFTLQATMFIRDGMTGSTGQQLLGFMKEKVNDLFFAMKSFSAFCVSDIVAIAAKDIFRKKKGKNPTFISVTYQSKRDESI